MRGLVVDLFAGGGGASTGIRAALGRDPDLAVNHDATAIAVHTANHPTTRHLTCDVYEVDPLVATAGRPVSLLWASPDCRHFSRAKGSAPKHPKVRSLAWVVTRWARAVRPAVILLENVPEFVTWGPLGRDRQPIRERAGETFKAWVAALRRLGYVVEWRELDASRYGAPTKRKRLFVVARRDGIAPRWPVPTHGPGLTPFRTAAECIDWTLPCPSIFDRKKPLAEKTLWRIAQGIRRYVIESASPFIVKVNHGGRSDRSEDLTAPMSTVTSARRGHALVIPSIVEPGQRHGRGDREGDAPLSTIVAKDRHALVTASLIDMQRDNAPPAIDDPLRVVTTQHNRHNLVTAFLAKHYGGVVGHDLREPTGTITGTDHHGIAAATLVKMRGACHGADAREPIPTLTGQGTHVAEVRAFLTAYYGTGVGQGLNDPARTLTARHRLGLVTVEGVEHQIVDIGMRMLQPHELLRAQFGEFAEGYDLSAARTASGKVRLVGNSVCPHVAAALVRANVGREGSEVAA